MQYQYGLSAPDRGGDGSSVAIQKQRVACRNSLSIKTEDTELARGLAIALLRICVLCDIHDDEASMDVRDGRMMDGGGV